MYVELFERDLSEEAFDYLSSREAVGVDTETSGLEPRLSKLALVQVSDETGGRVAVVHKPSRHSENLRALLERTLLVKVFHYARFDLAFLTHHLGVGVPQPRCTCLLARALRPGESAHLKDLVECFLGVRLEKGAERFAFVENPEAHVTPAILEYAARDAAVLVPLLRRLESSASPEQLARASRAWARLPSVVARDLRAPRA